MTTNIRVINYDKDIIYSLYVNNTPIIPMLYYKEITAYFAICDDIVFYSDEQTTPAYKLRYQLLSNNTTIIIYNKKILQLNDLRSISDTQSCIRYINLSNSEDLNVKLGDKCYVLSSIAMRSYENINSVCDNAIFSVKSTSINYPIKKGNIFTVILHDDELIIVRDDFISDIECISFFMGRWYVNPTKNPTNVVQLYTPLIDKVRIYSVLYDNNYEILDTKSRFGKVSPEGFIVASSKEEYPNKSNYIVHYSDMQYAIIGTPDRSLHVILTRRNEPIDPKMLECLNIIARSLGYKV